MDLLSAIEKGISSVLLTGEIWLNWVDLLFSLFFHIFFVLNGPLFYNKCYVKIIPG